MERSEAQARPQKPFLCVIARCSIVLCFFLYQLKKKKKHVQCTCKVKKACNLTPRKTSVFFCLFFLTEAHLGNSSGSLWASGTDQFPLRLLPAPPSVMHPSQLGLSVQLRITVAWQPGKSVHVQLYRAPGCLPSSWSPVGTKFQPHSEFLPSESSFLRWHGSVVSKLFSFIWFDYWNGTFRSPGSQSVLLKILIFYINDRNHFSLAPLFQQWFFIPVLPPLWLWQLSVFLIKQQANQWWEISLDRFRKASVDCKHCREPKHAYTHC